jgi:hypothetical protein
LAVLLLAVPVLAQAPPSGDTFASSATPKLNYGSSIILAVAPGTNSYVKFNLAGIPAGASISKATLRLYVDAAGYGRRQRKPDTSIIRVLRSSTCGL